MRAFASRPMAKPISSRLAEMTRLYKGYEEALTRTMKVVDACQFSLDELAYDYPREPVPSGVTAQQHLIKLSYEGAIGAIRKACPPKSRPASSMS